MSTVIVLVVLAAAAYVAYLKVPAVKAAVASALDKVFHHNQ